MPRILFADNDFPDIALERELFARHGIELDVATERVESPEDVAKVIRSALRFVPPERLHPCTNCGMVPLPRDVARAKLEALGAGAALVRAELG